MKYSIVIPTYNHLEDHLKPCLESIFKNTFVDDRDVEVIVVANGCTDGTREYVNRLGRGVRLINFYEPLGYTRATNVGIQNANGEYVVLLNNDNIILDFQQRGEWLSMMAKPFEDPTVGISAVSKLFFDAEKKETVPEVGRLGGWFGIFFCAMIPNRLFKEVGLLDEIFNPGVGEDVDFCLRALKKGYRTVGVPLDEPAKYGTTFPIYHKNSGTFSHIEGSADNYRRGMEILTQRYLSGYYD